MYLCQSCTAGASKLAVGTYWHMHNSIRWLVNEVITIQAKIIGPSMSKAHKHIKLLIILVSYL